jgi:hypothetical protein
MRQTEVEWSLDGIEWRPASDTGRHAGGRGWDERAKLRGSVTINGVPIHIEAHPVDDDGYTVLAS